jgi:hypothetical protein
MRTSRSISLLGCVAIFATACASSYYASYSKLRPDWTSAFPDPGAGLYETLAGLQGPHQFDYRLSISKLAVLQVSGDAATELSQDEIQRALAAPPGDLSFGVVAIIDCRSEIDVRMYAGQMVEWMLLENGRLSAWDVHPFASRCVYFNDFHPATRETAALERQIRNFRDTKFPRSTVNPIEYYRKGLAYSLNGQPGAAEEMLAKGDGGFDRSDPSGVRFERPSDRLQLVTPDDTAYTREQLVRAIGVVEPASTSR